MNFTDHLREEHAYLRALADKVGQETPSLAAQLGRHAGDPDVECLIQGAAMLNAGLRQRLEDGFPEVTQGHLARTWPFPLRPIPACGVVNVSAKASTLEATPISSVGTAEAKILVRWAMPKPMPKAIIERGQIMAKAVERGSRKENK